MASGSDAHHPRDYARMSFHVTCSWDSRQSAPREKRTLAACTAGADEAGSADSFPWLMSSLTSCPEEVGHRTGGLGQELFIDDEVATEDGVGLVPCDLHGDGLLNPGADEIPNRRPTKIMQ